MNGCSACITEQVPLKMFPLIQLFYVPTFIVFIISDRIAEPKTSNLILPFGFAEHSLNTQQTLNQCCFNVGPPSSTSAQH